MKVVFFLLGVLSGIAQASGGPYEAAHTSSGVRPMPSSAMAAELRALAAEFSDWVSVDVVGRSAGGREILAVRIEKPQAVCGTRPAVVLVGGLHGNEALGWEARLARFFVEARESAFGVKRWLRNLGVIYVIPIANPDGWDAGLRDNAHGADLALDFDLPPENEAITSEPETQALLDYFQGEFARRGLKPQLAVDFHCCGEGMTIPWSYSQNALPEDRRLRHAGFAFEAFKGLGRTLPVGTSWDVHGYSVYGGFVDYFFGQYGAMAFEFNGNPSDAQAFESHQAMWDALLNFAIDEVELD